MTLFSLAEIKQRNEERGKLRRWPVSANQWRPGPNGGLVLDDLWQAAIDTTVDDIDALIEEIQRLRAIRLPSGNDR